MSHGRGQAGYLVSILAILAFIGLLAHPHMAVGANACLTPTGGIGGTGITGGIGGTGITGGIGGTGHGAGGIGGTGLPISAAPLPAASAARATVQAVSAVLESRPSGAASAVPELAEAVSAVPVS